MLKYCILIIAFISIVSCHQCRDQGNDPVEWFFVYKLPQDDKNENELISTGAAYAYMTSNDYKDGWNVSHISINDSNSLIGLTLKPLYDSNRLNDNVYIIYNDQMPDGSINFRKGHSKGIVFGNSNGGVWVIHSIPRFPSIDEGQYFVPHNGFLYGQSILCVSFDLVNLNKIGRQLQYNDPSVYEKHMPDALKSKLPNLENVINNIPITASPWYNLVPLVSLNNSNFLSFAKARKFNKDLYEDWVAPTINASLFVESWLNGPGRLPSNCNKVFHVLNIETIDVKAANFQFKTSTDHSKWAVTPESSSQNSSWICVGDINRMKPENRRGGGTLCFSNNNVAKAYQDSVTTTEACP